jgi:hypothetical protein
MKTKNNPKQVPRKTGAASVSSTGASADNAEDIEAFGHNGFLFLVSDYGSN